MSKKNGFNELTKLFRGYRLKIHCFNCGEEYITNRMPKFKMPRKCKYCHSIKMIPYDYYTWELLNIKEE